MSRVSPSTQISFNVKRRHMQPFCLRQTTPPGVESDEPLNIYAATKSCDSLLSYSTGRFGCKGRQKRNDDEFTALPWEKVLRRPLVGSLHGHVSILTVGSYLSEHVVCFLHHTKHRRPIGVLISVTTLRLLWPKLAASKRQAYLDTA